MIKTIFAALIVTLLLAPVAGAEQPDTDQQYTVLFAPEAKLNRELQQQGLDPQQAEILTHVDVAVVDLSTEQAAELNKDPDVLAVEPDGLIKATELGLENNASQLPNWAQLPWGLDRIDQRSLPLDNSFQPRGTGAGQTIYIIDSGINSGHQEFNTRVLPGWGYNGSSADCNGHGTHVAGTAAGSTVGVATGAQLRPVRVLDCYGRGQISWLLSGIDWIIANNSGAAIANLSLSAGAVNEVIDSAVSSLYQNGVTPVIAAGNRAADACNESPARVPEAVTVGAVDSSDQRANFSNYGPCVDIWAPGVDIFSAHAMSNEAYVYNSGTSMAAPHIAGALALAGNENEPLRTSSLTNNDQLIFVGSDPTPPVDDPGSEDPINEDPGSDDPTPPVDDPGSEAPINEDPGSDDPTPPVDDPVSEDPGSDDPTPPVDDPGSDDPINEDPGSDDPTPPVDDPINEDPINEDPTPPADNPNPPPTGGGGGGGGSAPKNKSLPQISADHQGEFRVGDQLQASPGQWDGTPAPGFAYQWLRCSGQQNCQQIAGAQQAEYQLGDVDRGLGIAVTVIAKNASGQAEAQSAVSSAVVQQPVNTALPIINSSPQVGVETTVSPGEWRGWPEPEFTYQWLRCQLPMGAGNVQEPASSCQIIPGATSSSYRPTEDDLRLGLIVSVSASNSAGDSSVRTAISPATVQAPKNIVQPVISGTPQVGQQLSVNTGQWQGWPEPELTYQWLRCQLPMDAGNVQEPASSCQIIPEATASNYRPTVTDLGLGLSVAIIASNIAGAQTMSTAASQAVLPARRALLSKPVISYLPGNRRRGTLRITIANRGQLAITALAIKVRAAGLGLVKRVVRLSGGERRALGVKLRFARPGKTRLTVSFQAANIKTLIFSKNIIVS